MIDTLHLIFLGIEGELRETHFSPLFGFLLLYVVG